MLLTLTNPEDAKEALNEELNCLLNKVNLNNKLFLLRDFNAWANIFGHSGTGSCNGAADSLIPNMLLYGQLKQGQRGLELTLNSVNIQLPAGKGGGIQSPKASRPLNGQEPYPSKPREPTGIVVLSPKYRSKFPAVSVEDFVSQG